MNFFFDLRVMILVILILLISWNNWDLSYGCRCRCLVDLGKINLNTWFNSDQTIFWIRPAQVNVSGVNEIPPLLPCPFWFGIDAHEIIN